MDFVVVLSFTTISKLARWNFSFFKLEFTMLTLGSSFGTSTMVVIEERLGSLDCPEYQDQKACSVDNSVCARLELLRQILLRPRRATKEAVIGLTPMLPPSHCEEIMRILGPPEALMGGRASLPYSWSWLLLLPCLKMHLQASVTQIPCVLLILQSALRPMWPSVVAAEDPESENASFPTE
nr:hypothetical protein [Tanacetum cinerariifolium]